MTKRICLLTLLITSSLFSVEIPTQHASKRMFSKSVELNAQIIQLSNASQSVTTQISGHLEKYYVHAGERVKAGQKIALIESIEVSKMTANFVSLKKQYEALDKNYIATKKLYDSGMTSMQELNNQSIQKNAMLAKINALKSQLHTLNVDTSKLKKASPNFTLYAHSAGKVSQLLMPLHTVVRVDEALINILKEQAFYVKSFLPLTYAAKVKVGQKMVVNYNGRNIITHVTQILPEVDETTQRIVVLSSVDERADDLYINSYVKSTLYFKADKQYVAVKKSALSFFNNEWVVFVPKKDFEKSSEVTENEEEEEYVSPYEARVVEIITQDDKYAGVEGLESGEEYVSAKSYYVKSMILKSSLGDGD
jgi:multidrug efflux pump subunit AcrA (membrane-fusion protein)